MKKFFKNNKGKLAVGGALLAGLVGAEIGSEFAEGFGGGEDFSFEGGGGEEFGGGEAFGGGEEFGGGEACGGGEAFGGGGGEEYAGADVAAAESDAYAQVQEQMVLQDQQGWETLESAQISAAIDAQTNANTLALI